MTEQEMVVRIEHLEGLVAELSEIPIFNGFHIGFKCPWCEFSRGFVGTIVHVNSCPAFTPEGELK